MRHRERRVLPGCRTGLARRRIASDSEHVRGLVPAEVRGRARRAPYRVWDLAQGRDPGLRRAVGQRRHCDRYDRVGEHEGDPDALAGVAVRWGLAAIPELPVLVDERRMHVPPRTRASSGAGTSMTPRSSRARKKRGEGTFSKSNVVEHPPEVAITVPGKKGGLLHCFLDRGEVAWELTHPKIRAVETPAQGRPAVESRARSPRGPTPLSSEGMARLRRRPSQRQAVTMWMRPANRAPPSRPHPHRFCNYDSSRRQRHRLPPHPGLLRHPTQSVYGTERSILVRLPRENSGNNMCGETHGTGA